MGKKKAFTKGNTKGGKVAKNIFKVATATQGKKKTKVVKTQIKKIQANVKSQQESSDRQLKTLHEQMVVKKAQPNNAKKIKVPARKAKGPAPKTTQVQNNLQKMNVG